MRLPSESSDYSCYDSQGNNKYRYKKCSNNVGD